jgi:hypothetical protein
MSTIFKKTRDTVGIETLNRYAHEYFIDNNEKVKYYTGLPNYNVLMAVFRLLEPHIPITDRSLLDPIKSMPTSVCEHVPVSTSCSTDTVLVLSVSRSWSKAEAASLCFFFEDLLMFRAYLELRVAVTGIF